MNNNALMIILVGGGLLIALFVVIRSKPGTVTTFGDIKSSFDLGGATEDVLSSLPQSIQSAIKQPVIGPGITTNRTGSGRTTNEP